MSKITIVEGNSNDKDNVRAIMVKGEKGDMGDLNHNDIIDNLTSTATNKVLSAKQGKVLKDLIDGNEANLEENYPTKADLNTEATTRANADMSISNALNVERARIDVLSTLEEGSTTGDAELQDIRIAYDGNRYASAGNSVRGQASTINNDLNNRFNNLINNKIITQLENSCVIGRSFVQNDVSVFDATQTTYCTTKIISVPYAKKIKIKIRDGYNYVAYKTAYNEYGHPLGNVSGGYVDTETEYEYASSFPYIVITARKDDNSVLTLSDIEKLITIEVENISKIPTLSYDFDYLNKDLNNRFDNLLNDKIINHVSHEISIGRLYTSNGIAAFDETQTSFCSTNFILIPEGKSLKFKIKNGYKYLVWRSVQGQLGSSIGVVSGGFITTDFTYNYNSTYPYAAVTIQDANNKSLILEDVKDILTIEYETELNITELRNDANIQPIATKGQILYEGDTKSNSGFICNAISYDDGTIIACRSNGKVVRIDLNGTETVLLSFTGTLFDFRCLYMDKNKNIYVSPHASWGSMNVEDRGLYRLVKGENTFTKVISLYNPTSSVTTETENNNDTIWTMCEDDEGNLYAGVYAHTIRSNPAIYKSIDNGVTWNYVVNFNTAGLTTNGMHIHTIIYSKWQKALYCIVGEINEVFKSTDGINWSALGVQLKVKGSSMLATKYGILIGSDGAFNCEIDLLYNDDKTHKTVFSGWANTIFAIRQSDLTGFIYAFTKIDSSVNSLGYYPPETVVSGTTTIEEWQSSVSSDVYNRWLEYHDSVVDEYPEDAIRPRHYAIIVSRDGGLTWEPIRFACPSDGANGIWTTGYFLNGECLTGKMVSHSSLKPIVISEGKHKYVENGCDLSGEIFIKTNSSNIVSIL